MQHLHESATSGNDRGNRPPENKRGPLPFALASVSAGTSVGVTSESVFEQKVSFGRRCRLLSTGGISAPLWPEGNKSTHAGLNRYLSACLQSSCRLFLPAPASPTVVQFPVIGVNVFLSTYHFVFSVTLVSCILPRFYQRFRLIPSQTVDAAVLRAGCRASTLGWAGTFFLLPRSVTRHPKTGLGSRRMDP